MAGAFSPYVTIYDKRTLKGHLVYRASLQSFLKTGNYTQEKPAGATASETLLATQLPTAGREANRIQNAQLQTPGLETGEPISAVVRPEIAPEFKETNAQKHLREIEEPIAEPAPEPDPTPTVEASDESTPKTRQPRRRAKAKSESADSSATVSDEG